VRSLRPSANIQSSNIQSSIAAPKTDPEISNLLRLVRGAVAISRTAELTYENSAVHAIDGTIQTYWSSPPGGAAQTLVYALPALTRLTQLGVLATAPGALPEKVRFDVSQDGRSWTPIGTMPVERSSVAQKHPVHADARFIRVATLAPPAKPFVVLQSIIAEGQELEPPAPGAMAGCWLLNGVPARFEQHDSRVTGVILAPERPIQLDGGTNGRVNLMMWLQAPMWGYAAITVSRDGQHLSGVKWHEHVIWDHTGDGWIASRVDCADIAFQAPAIAEELLRRAGGYTLFGLRFDDQERLVPAASAATLDHLAQILPTGRFRLTARQQRRLDALREALAARGVDVTRVSFAATGSDAGGRSTFTEVEKLVVGSVELERVGG
jgi:hypothetical protein